MLHTLKLVLWIVPVLLLIDACKKGMQSTDKPQEKDSIEFSGYTWNVKHSSIRLGPGPNYWSSSNVWVDESGRLHLRLSRDTNGKWQCAEIYSRELFGYGTYQWWIEGSIDKLDKNVVLGLFTYSGHDGNDEMDIEFARWDSTALPNLSYTVWPAYGSTQRKWTVANEISQSDSFSTQRFIRSATSVSFQSMNGFVNDSTGEYFSATCTDSATISKDLMPIHLNLWLFNGKAPSDNKEVEIIIHKFLFIPK